MTATAQDTEKHPTLRERAGNEAKHLVDSTGKIVLIDFLLGITLGFYSVAYSGIRLPIFGSFLLIIVGLSRKPAYRVPQMGIVVATLVLALTWVTFDSVMLGISESGDVFRRLLRIVSVVLVALLIADKRLDFRSIILGLGFVSMLNIPAFYLGLAPDAYGGTLTGWFYDKNVSGMYYATTAILLIAVIEKLSHKFLIFTLFSGALWLTGSRTSIAALGFAFLWTVLARKMNIFLKGILAFAMIYAVNFLEENYAQAGVFANRVGSDLLRERIDKATEIKIDEAPWYGLGLGQAQVQLGENGRFFFHNSYWTLQIEGGYIYLYLIVGITIFAAFFFKQNAMKQRNLYGEGVTILLLICAWRLGEVFLTTSWGLIFGFVLSLCAVPIKDNLDQMQKYHRYLEQQNARK